CERDFFTIGDNAQLDDAMNRADNAVARVIQEIRARRRVNWVQGQNLALLVGFITLQMLRTKGMQLRQIEMMEQFAESVHEMGLELPEDWQSGLQRERQRETFLRHIPEQTGKLMPYLLDKDLILLSTTPAHPFLISDNPVVLNNTLNPGNGIRGTL